MTLERMNETDDLATNPYEEDASLVALYQESLAAELLGVIGVKCFVTHYFELKSGNAALLEYSPASVVNRLSASATLFHHGLHVAALKRVVDSSRTPKSLAETAKAILAVETL